MRSHRLALLCLLLASAAAAQPAAPFAAWFNWRDPHIAILPDSSGTFFWVQRGAAGDPGPSQTVAVTFDPAKIDAWTTGARAFMVRTLTDADTGATRNSLILRGTGGDGMYLVRQRLNGAWSEDGIMALESPKDTAPLLIQGGRTDILEILDSLQVVGRVTPFSDAVSRRVLAETAEKKFDKEARPDPTNRPPQYPLGKLRTHEDGLVIVSFVISARGTVDLTTVRPFLVSDPAFLDATMTALPFLRFFPAIKGGGEVESRVTMPFQFSVVRKPGR